MEIASAVAARPIKKRRRDGKAEDGPLDAPVNNFELLSAVAQQLSSGPAQGGSMQRPPPFDDAMPPASNGWHRKSAPVNHQLSHPRPLRPPPRFGSISDPQVSTAALQATAHGSIWGVSAWLESHRTAALLRGNPGDTPVLGSQKSGQFSRGDVRKLVAQVCAMRTPNLLSGDKVQAALECAKDTQLRLTWREARGAPSAQAGKQHEDANLAELLLQLSSTLADISAAAGCFKDALGAVVGGQHGHADNNAAETPVDPAVIAELTGLVQAAERQAQLLRRVELACVAAAESSVSQHECLKEHRRAAHRCWSAAVVLENICSERRRLLNRMLKLPADEVGDELLGLLDGLRSNVAAALEAAARKDALAAKLRAQQAALLRSGLPGVSAQALVAGHLEAVADRDLLRLYTLIRIVQNLKAQFVQLAKEVQAAMRAGFWRMSLREPAASGSVTALEASMSLAVEVVAGCTDDWAAPEVASARLAAQHLTQVLEKLTPTMRRVVTEFSVNVTRRDCWTKLKPPPAPAQPRRNSSLSSGLSRLEEEPAERSSLAHLRTRSADTPLTANAFSPAAAGRLQADVGAILAAAQHQPQPDAAAQTLRGMPQQELLFHMLSQIQQQQQQQSSQPAGGERINVNLPNGSRPGAELTWNAAATQMQ